MPLQLISDELTNVLVYGDGNIEVNSEISTYENVVANTPIQGSVMITHGTSSTIDINSFQIGDKPLKVKFVQSVPMSVSNNLEIAIYSFQIDGLPAGQHTLPPIQVKVGGKLYQALPLVIQVGGS